MNKRVGESALVVLAPLIPCAKIYAHKNRVTLDVVLAPLIPCAKIDSTIISLVIKVVLAPLIPCAKILFAAVAALSFGCPSTTYSLC